MKKLSLLILGLIGFILLQNTPLFASNNPIEIELKEATNFTSDQNYNYAQSLIYPGMKYREYKKLYSVRDYESAIHTRYSPFWSGAASFLITGLGQTCCGQFWRGLAFWGGKWIAVGVGEALLGDGGGAVAYLGVCLWSIIDASRVAKIKSMYTYDIRRITYRSDISIDVYPSLNCISSTAYGTKTTPGMTLSLTF